MIDLETFGTRGTSVFLSIAATPFNLETGEMGKPFLKNVDLQSALDAGLTIDADTIKWWLQQDPAIAAKMFADPEPLGDVLRAFTIWWYENELIYPWSNGATFDIVIMDNAYDQCKLQAPWKFWNERCYRTLASLYKRYQLAKPANMHDPIVDNQFQIENLCHVWRIMNEPRLRDSELESSYGAALSLLHNTMQALTNSNEKVKHGKDASVDIMLAARKIQEFLDGGTEVSVQGLGKIKYEWIKP